MQLAMHGFARSSAPVEQQHFLEYDKLTYWKFGEVEKSLSLLDKLLVATISTNKANRQT